jgi:F-type H+-transporting ATPase subunit b
MKKLPVSLFAMAALYALPAAAEEGGLPQFDVTLFPEQLFWLAVSFTVLYCVMKFVALPGVETAQSKRRGIIEGELETARKANEQAREMGHEADKALAIARAKAQDTITTIKADASKLASEQQAVQSKELGQKLREAEAAIAKTRDAALKEIDGAAAELAAAIVDNVAGGRVKA